MAVGGIQCLDELTVEPSMVYVIGVAHCICLTCLRTLLPVDVIVASFSVHRVIDPGSVYGLGVRLCYQAYHQSLLSAHVSLPRHTTSDTFALLSNRICVPRCISATISYIGALSTIDMSFLFGGSGSGGSKARASAAASPAGPMAEPRELTPDNYIAHAAHHKRQTSLATHRELSNMPLDEMLTEMVVSQRFKFTSSFAEVPGQPFLDLPTGDKIFQSRMAPEETTVEDVRAIVAGRRQPAAAVQHP